MKSKLLSSRNRIHLQLHDYTQKIAVNNSSQKVRILYKNPDKPLLLWVDGGILDFCCSDAGKYLDHYTDIFVVAYWQPELKAFNSVNQVLKCLFNISHKLKSQFFMNKIYLLGHSFGTLFTLPAVKMYPKLYYSYLAVGQYINLLKNYQAFHKEILKNLNNKYSISAYILKKYETVTYKNLCQYDRFIRINGLLNAWCPNKSSVCRLFDLKKLYKKLRLNGKLFDEILQSDFSKNMNELNIPVYFFNGRLDKLCSTESVYGYFKQLNTPVKTFLWFESSGHYMFIQENKKFETLLKKIAAENLDKL